jgi:large repetitive protein
VPGGTSPSGWIPAVHLGTDGKLRSSLFWHSDVNARLVSPGATTYNDGNWHHVAVTYANGVETLYIDGVQVGQQAQPEVAYSGSYNYYLGTGYAAGWTGGNGGWHFFGGKLDEAALYQRALSGTEVGQHFAAVAASPPIASGEQPPATAKLQMEPGLEVGTPDDGIVARRNRARVLQWRL